MLSRAVFRLIVSSAAAHLRRTTFVLDEEVETAK